MSRVDYVVGLVRLVQRSKTAATLLRPDTVLRKPAEPLPFVRGQAVVTYPLRCGPDPSPDGQVRFSASPLPPKIKSEKIVGRHANFMA